MVVFTCNHCGDSLQKPKVEKHYTFVCRTVKSLTCVDCLKDFRGEEYASHTKCVTEDERYAAKGTYNNVVKKGEAKQETWVEMVKSILDNDQSLKPSCRNLLNNITSFNNIPRKKPKFINFIKSSFGGRVNLKDVEEVWNVIEKYKNDKAQKEQEAKGENGSSNGKANSQENQNGSNEGKEKKNKENKRKTDDSESTPKKKKQKTKKSNEVELEVKTENGNIETTESAPKKEKKHKKQTTQNEEVVTANNEEVIEENAKFNFQEKILSVVTGKESISLKKLQKKVLNAYMKETSETEVTPKAIKKFNKKLKKIPNLQINEEVVTVLEATS